MILTTGAQNMSGTEQQQTAFQFGVFEINPHTRELRKHGVRIKLQDQPLQILLVLLEHSDEIVTREEIQKRLWPENTHVDFDNAINSAVRKLREALGDSPENPRFVETMARRGYRFIAPVSRPARASPILSQPVQVPVSALLPTAGKRRMVWIACTLAVVLGAVGMALQSWISNSNQVRLGRPFPAVPLSGNPGYEAFPTFSPEGTRVAFAWQEPGKQWSNIYIKLIGQGDPIRLTTSPAGDFAPTWSPDGRFIAFLRALGTSRAAIIIIPCLGGQERELAEITLNAGQLLRHTRSYDVAPPFLAWSPDGQWLLSVGQNAPHQTLSIVRVSVETGEKRTLTSPSIRGTGDGSVAVSPDGKTLAFTRTLGLYERDIYLVPLSKDMLAGGEPSRLTFDGKEIDGLAWTTDGHGLIFSSKRGGRRELWQMPVMPAGEPVRLIAAGDAPGDVAIAREGHRLVYSHSASNAHIWRIALVGSEKGQAHALISSSRTDGHSQYSPDGLRIAFESNRSGHDEIWICRADGSHPVQLTAFRAWAGSPRWSPDGQRIAFDSNAAGNWDIYVINAQGGHPVRLTTSEANQYRPSWSHDGKWIYYCSTRTQQRQIWKIPASGGAEVQVTKHGGFVAFESVDGKDLYLTKEEDLWKMPLQGGEESRISPSLFQNNFARAAAGVYLLEGPVSAENTVRLQFVDFATQAVRTIAVVPAPTGNEISVSPDEHWLLFDKADRTGSELMVIENFH